MDKVIIQRDNVGMEQTKRSTTVLIIIGVFVAVLVVVAVVMAAKPPTEFDPGSPQATAQGFYQAINDDDGDLAWTFLTDELQDECENQRWYYDRDESLRVVITDDDIEGDAARLDVTITISYGDGPFDGGSYDEDDTMVMERTGDVWLISEPVWPMDRYACREGNG